MKQQYVYVIQDNCSYYRKMSLPCKNQIRKDNHTKQNGHQMLLLKHNYVCEVQAQENRNLDGLYSIPTGNTITADRNDAILYVLVMVFDVMHSTNYSKLLYTITLSEHLQIDSQPQCKLNYLRTKFKNTSNKYNFRSSHKMYSVHSKLSSKSIIQQN